MPGCLRHQRLSALALALYAFATLAVGFAHKPLAPLHSHDLIVLAQQGDAPLSFCDRSGVPMQQIADRLCDACALVSAPGLPARSDCALPVRNARQLSFDLAVRPQLAPQALYAPVSRGPPAA